MASAKPFKIIIVGGGIAGLALANMLEAFSIDYVLLESHAEIAPAEGASIGMLPNGLLILDQLGLYDMVHKIARTSVITTSRTRDSSGQSLVTTEHLQRRIVERHGYPLSFFDRQSLLQLLFNHIRHKDKIQVNQRVEGIELTSNAVKVTTRAGNSFSGDLVVGADGVHSAVRKEMYRIAENAPPGLLPPGEEESLPCDYQCSFGIAEHVPNHPAGEQTFVTGRGKAFVLVPGPGKKLYWFLFVKLPRTLCGKDVPRYSKQDEADFTQANANLRITEKLTFGDVYARRLSSGLTALHEFVLQRWGFGRIFLMGDSCHKPNPIIGMGGNDAVETAAAFTNDLLNLRDRQQAQAAELNDTEIENFFKETQLLRHSRVKQSVWASRIALAVFSYEWPAVSFVAWSILSPFLGADIILGILAVRLAAASKIDRLPVPHRRHILPYNHELPAKPIGSWATETARVAFILCMGSIFFVGLNAMRLPDTIHRGWTGFDSLNTARFSISNLSKILEEKIAALSLVITGPDSNAKIHLAYRLTSLMSHLLVYTVEGHRASNQGTLLALPSIFMASVQVFGVAQVAPLHAVLVSLQMSDSPVGRSTGLTATTIMPALILGYIIPTVLMFIPSSDLGKLQDHIGFWSFSPLLVCLFVQSASMLVRRRRRITKPTGAKLEVSSAETECEDEEDEEEKQDYDNGDVSSLKLSYAFVGILQLAVHLTIMGYVYRDSNLDFYRFFLYLHRPFENQWSDLSLASAVSTAFRYDLVLAQITALSQNVYSIWSLRCRGYVANSQAVKAAGAVIVGQFLFGYGATWIGLWYWRESSISGLSRW